MSKLVGENRAYLAAAQGVKLGETRPSKETKGSWFEVYFHKNEIIAVIFFDTQNCYIADGEIIDESELKMYTEDPEEAIAKLLSLRG